MGCSSRASALGSSRSRWVAVEARSAAVRASAALAGLSGSDDGDDRELAQQTLHVLEVRRPFDVHGVKMP
jgi:hypothetical protein